MRLLPALQHGLSGLRNETTDINLKRVPDAQERIKRGVPRARFQGADERLAQTCLLGKQIAGNALSLALRHKQPDNFGADLISRMVFGHTFPLAEKPLDGAYHYNDTQAAGT